MALLLVRLTAAPLLLLLLISCCYQSGGAAAAAATTAAQSRRPRVVYMRSNGSDRHSGISISLAVRSLTRVHALVRELIL
eukprot:COSAG01_NODE_54127_length_334_cov_0.863830_1_plen_79_part_01